MDPKPCPLCGSKNIFLTEPLNPDEYGVMCNACGCVGPLSEDGEVAILAWNTRQREHELEQRILENEMFVGSVRQMVLDLFTWNVYVKEKMESYIGLRMLVALSNSWVTIATYRAFGWVHNTGEELISVTHWMPIPQPPEGE